MNKEKIIALVLTIVAIFKVVNSFGQVYHSFPTDSAQWSVMINTATNTSNYTGTFHQNLKGDTNTNYAITLDVYASLNQLKIILQYNNELITDESILKIKGHFETLFESLLSDAEYIKELNYLTKKEEQLLIEFNNTEADYDKDKTVLDLITEQVLLNPEATALVFEICK